MYRIVNHGTIGLQTSLCGVYYTCKSCSQLLAQWPVMAIIKLLYRWARSAPLKYCYIDVKDSNSKAIHNMSRVEKFIGLFVCF